MHKMTKYVRNLTGAYPPGYAYKWQLLWVTLSYVAAVLGSGCPRGPALSRCSCIGPRAMVVGQVVHFFQISLALKRKTVSK